jgi:hypothetical protein
MLPGFKLKVINKINFKTTLSNKNTKKSGIFQIK